jgi:Cys-tRNA(Pro)/Cys-tRNA(Cys) deacylase
VPHTLHPYRVSVDTPDYGRAVAEALGAPPERVFKTLVAEVGGDLVVAVVPVTGELDLKALAAATGGSRPAAQPPGAGHKGAGGSARGAAASGKRKARIADRAAAERATGYVRGGISPFGQRRRLPTVVDSTATGFDTIYVSAGRRGLQVELPPAELIRLTGATLAAIAR